MIRLCHVVFTLYFLLHCSMNDSFLFNRFASSQYTRISINKSFLSASFKPIPDLIYDENIDFEDIAVAEISLSGSNQGVRGVIATKAIQENDIIIKVPSYLSLETTNNRPPTPFPDFVPQDLWEKSMWDQRLAYKLLYEMQINTASIHTNWIRTLPNSFSTTYYWTDEELSMLQYKSLMEKIRKQRKDWENIFQNFQAVTKTGKCISLQSFIMALECINSRSFSGVFEGSSASDRRSLYLFTGALTLLWPALHLGSVEQSVSAAITVGFSIFIRDLFLSKALDLKRYVLCPYIDMINHKSSSKTDVSYNYFLDQFEVKSQAYNVNEQIFLSYGKQSNDRLLQYYGFIEEDNPNDVYEFDNSIISILLNYGNELQSSVPFPTYPTPEQRIELLGEVLSSSIVSQSKVKSESTSFTQLSDTSDKFVFNKISNSENPSAIGKTFVASELLMKLFQSKINSNGKFDILNHVDEITLRSLRLLYSTEIEWKSIIQKPTYEILEYLELELSELTELKISKAIKEIIMIELNSKETSIEQDITELSRLQKSDPIKKGFSEQKSNLSSKITSNPSGIFERRDLSALTFRIEKKNLLQTLANLNEL